VNDFWDARYAEPALAYGDQPNDFVREVADRIPPGPVLCLAEGQGRNAVFLAERGHAVTAVDQSAVGLERARALAASRGVHIETVVADLADWTIPAAPWSAVVLIFAHLPPPLRARVHGAAAAALAPGGVVVLEAYGPDQLRFGTGGPPVPELLFTTEQLEADFAGLTPELSVALEREIHEGQYHHGPSAVVRLLARKPG
jgi:SAM-dependent methyltransferase